jgi:hypothetical protein
VSDVGTGLTPPIAYTLNMSFHLTRRGLMAATAAVGGTALWPASEAAAAAKPGERQFADAILDAFDKHRVVALGEVHGQQEHADAVQLLLTDPRLPDVVDDIVVEFGNALYQSTVDSFTAGGAVEDADLRRVWRDTTQSPLSNWDAPMYEQIYRTVRAINWMRPANRQVRLLLGDPALDWSKVTSAEQLEALDRDGHLATVVEREVLARGRKALILYGMNHLKHAPPGDQGRSSGGVARIEWRTGQRVYVVLSGGHPRLAATARRTVVPAAGTWLGTADSGEFTYFSGECGVPFGLLADALLYLGPFADQTACNWNPAIYLDPVYWTELQHRNRIRGGNIDLDRLRQPQPVRWPVPGSPCC